MTSIKATSAATVVITGAAGFLGRALGKIAADSGHRVVAVSRRPIAGMTQVDDYRRTPGGDVLIHLAEEPDRAVVNRLGDTYVRQVRETVEALARHRYQRVIYASSAAVYGDQRGSPCGIDLKIAASDAYSQAKLSNEGVVLDSEGVVLRLSNLFGPGMSENNVISDILRQVPGDGPVVVRDDQPVRDYLWVADAATVFNMMIANHYCGLLNVGSGIGSSVRTIAQLALGLVQQGTREILASVPGARPSTNVLDISRTTELLGWTPAYSLRAGLAHLLTHRNGS